MLDLSEAFDMVMQKPHSRIWTRVVSQTLASGGLGAARITHTACKILLIRLGIGLRLWFGSTCTKPLNRICFTCDGCKYSKYNMVPSRAFEFFQIEL